MSPQAALRAGEAEQAPRARAGCKSAGENKLQLQFRGSQQGTYIGQFADCVRLHCDVVLLQLLLDLVDALGDVFCLRKTNKNFSSSTGFSSFQHVGGEKQQQTLFASTNLTYTQFSKHLILTQLLIKKTHHNSVKKPKI